MKPEPERGDARWLAIYGTAFCREVFDQNTSELEDKVIYNSIEEAEAIADWELEIRLKTWHSRNP